LSISFRRSARLGKGKSPTIPLRTDIENPQEQDFEAQRVNTLLKHLGLGVGNITRSLESLKSRKPQHVVQLRKSGTARQARKRYKVTAAGRDFVRELTSANRGIVQTGR
jgi:hypothetical protein